jgi:prepilin-type N-terminal cleavage/methylation domain-containing protein
MNNRPWNRILLDNRGLTLVELMIVLVLSLMLMAAVFMTFQLQHTSSRAQTEVAATQQDIRAAMDIIALDIMHAGLSQDPSVQIPGIPGGTSGADTLRLENDGTVDGVTRVIYRLNNGNLERDLNIGVTQVIASNVTSLTFAYRGTTTDGGSQDIVPAVGGTLTADQAEQVRFIRVAITKESAQVDAQTGQPVQRTLSRWVCRRNGDIDEISIP